MFTLKHHVRKNAHLVAVGAAASLGLIAAHSQAATLTWDPAPQNPTSPNGGSGNFNNTDPNFSNGTTDVAATSSSDVDFTTTGGAVNINAATSVNSLAIGVDGYSFSGSTLTLPAANTTVLSLNSGNATFTAPINMSAVNGVTASINVATGSILTIGNLTQGVYASFNKTGGGLLALTGTFSQANVVGSTAVDIQGGLQLGGAGTHAFAGGGGVTVEPGASLSGNSANLTNSVSETLAVNGHLAPGINTGATNFGGVGTFSIKGSGNNTTPSLTGSGVYVNFGAASDFDLDLASPDSAPGVFDGAHDRLAMTSGNYGGAFVTVTAGATVNLSGTYTPGTYHILSLANTPGHTANNSDNPLDVTYGGFTIGTDPYAGAYSYSFAVTGTGPNDFTGIDLIVTAAPPVPEPASLTLLGLGAGVLLTRKRRRSLA